MKKCDSIGGLMYVTVKYKIWEELIYHQNVYSLGDMLSFYQNR